MTEKIITAFAESACGPGWANKFITVIFRDENQALQERTVQPDEMTSDMWQLFAISEAINAAMVGAVRKSQAPAKRKGTMP